ncbi:MAG: helix-hairpin-helix domain-containing protein [Pseudomonadota bacterium]
MPKAQHASEVHRFTDIPNVGAATAGDFATLGLRSPAELANCDAWTLYRRLCRITGVRHDPCVIDVFLAAIDFMRGAPARPWWHYTPERKTVFDAERSASDDARP